MSNQPKWKLVYSTDYSAVHVDETGVYPPELTIIEDCPLEIAAQSEGDRFNKDTNYSFVYRFPLEQCYLTKGVLSDNKFHKNSFAWFAEKLPEVARSCGYTVEGLTAWLCSNDPVLLALAYEALGSYFGFNEFDSYPIIETEDEVSERLSV